ncbi:hypothetical protein Glove_9g19 [Diversispora epigaea]|uniref:Uncharacterized protein n=1 Tax=Diversispora epigaea TaxID=1348612 RepID=A0A397JZJ3_9GLOM|nr:hypothetical protein Glove_9g19 [Diversispora epigaea]
MQKDRIFHEIKIRKGELARILNKQKNNGDDYTLIMAIMEIMNNGNSGSDNNNDENNGNNNNNSNDNKIVGSSIKRRKSLWNLKPVVYTIGSPSRKRCRSKPASRPPSSSPQMLSSPSPQVSSPIQEFSPFENYMTKKIHPDLPYSPGASLLGPYVAMDVFLGGKYLLILKAVSVPHPQDHRAVIFNSDNSNNDDYNKNILQHSNSFDSILTNSSKMPIQSLSTLSNDKKSITFRAARPVSPISFDAKTIQDLLVFINLNVNHLKISITKYVLQL